MQFLLEMGIVVRRLLLHCGYIKNLGAGTRNVHTFFVELKVFCVGTSKQKLYVFYVDFFNLFVRII